MMLIDVHESIRIEELLRQTIEVQRTALNIQGFADFMWLAADGHRVQVEHKQWDELLGAIDHTEEQLSKQLQNTDEQWLLVEGVAIPTDVGVDVYKEHDTKPIFVCRRKFGSKKRPMGMLADRIASWFWKLDKRGITVAQASNSRMMIKMLVRMYINSTDPSSDNRMLDRYIKPLLPGAPKNPYVRTLMGVDGANIGEVKARALISYFDTPWEVFSANPAEVANVELWPSNRTVGPAAAKALQQALGKQQ